MSLITIIKCPISTSGSLLYILEYTSMITQWEGVVMDTLVIWGQTSKQSGARSLNVLVCFSSPGLISPEKWTDQTVRCAVLALLKEMSQSTLAKLCPLTQVSASCSLQSSSSKITVVFQPALWILIVRMIRRFSITFHLD